MTDEHQMIAEMTRAVHHQRMGPKFEKWRKQGQMDRDTWAEMRRIGLACALPSPKNTAALAAISDMKLHL